MRCIKPTPLALRSSAGTGPAMRTEGGTVPEQYSWDQYLTRRIRDQVDYIVDAFAQEGAFYDSGRESVTVRAVDDDEGGIEYMYAEGHLLARDEHVQTILDIVESELGRASDPAHGRASRKDRKGDGERVQPERVVPGVTLIKLPAPGHGQPPPSVLPIIEQVDRVLGPGNATPDHVVTVAPGGPCPATEPEPAYFGAEPYPSVRTENSGAGIVVFVADTGLLDHAEHHHPWLRGVQRADNPDGSPQPPDPDRKTDSDGVERIPPYSGHGTFAAGLVRCMAPQAEVIVANIFKVAGSTLEHDLVQQLDRALRLGVDVFNLSIAANTRHNLTMLGFDGFLRRLSQYKGVVCVVAAGNNASLVPTYPAALHEMVSVGALGSDWRGRARFSNYGGWVDVYAPGRDLVNAFASGPYRCHDAPYKGEIRQFHGMARWSGTSFSTPMVTGLIAARMSRTGETGQEAAAALLAEARAQAIPGVGAILLPPDGHGPVPRPASLG
jgi:hypothetical protein